MEMEKTREGAYVIRLKKQKIREKVRKWSHLDKREDDALGQGPAMFVEVEATEEGW